LKSSRVADSELGRYYKDALHRNESCGGHSVKKIPTADGEATRDDENFAYVAAWEYKGNQVMLFLQREVGFDNVKLVTRSYK
jgi:succinate dehydrogenase / fumarate reductase flavoprotein subunit